MHCLSTRIQAPVRTACPPARLRTRRAIRALATAPIAPQPSTSAVDSLVISVDPEPPVLAPQRSGVPMWLAPAGVVGLVLAGLAYRKITGQGSVGGLVDRGYLNGNRARTDPFYSDVMKNVNTVKMEELSDEMIQAARARRSRERANQKLDLDNIELPENHPWAVKKQNTKEQEEAISARLKVRRGVPMAAPEQEVERIMEQESLRQRRNAATDPARK